MVPLNLLGEGETANYILTGSWSEKALAEAVKVGQTKVGASTKEEKFRRIPSQGSWRSQATRPMSTSPATTPSTAPSGRSSPTPRGALVADMSSDILSKPFDVSRFGLIYAGAQKNLGPSGVTVVIIRRISSAAPGRSCPPCSTTTPTPRPGPLQHAPTFGIYLLGKVLSWVERKGGVAAIARQNELKARILYDAIDQSGGFYRGHAERRAAP